jgi:hypothetical protein
MISKILPVLLVASLAACAGGPRPVPAPSTPLAQGTYDLTGHAQALGLVTATVHVDSAGMISVHRATVHGCPDPSITDSRETYPSCHILRVTPVGASASGERHAELTVVVRQNGRYCASRDGSQCTYWRQLGGMRSYSARGVLNRLEL